MKFYISDLHLGHEKIIKICDRPYSSLEEMNNALIENWNRKVKPTDEVYIVGDLFLKMPEKEGEEIIEKLNGTKYLIIGNHDWAWMGKVDLKKYFKKVTELMTIEDCGNKITLCHYPMMDFLGDFLVYGHIHNNTKDFYWQLLKTMDNAFNASVEINNFEPCTFNELVINNIKYKSILQKKINYIKRDESKTVKVIKEKECERTL